MNRTTGGKRQSRVLEAHNVSCASTNIKKKNTMQFHFIPKPVDQNHWTAGFTLSRIWARDAGSEREVSHLLDRRYPYQSPRELQWHLAYRFGLPAQAIELTSEA